MYSDVVGLGMRASVLCKTLRFSLDGKVILYLALLRATTHNRGVAWSLLSVRCTTSLWGPAWYQMKIEQDLEELIYFV